MKNTSLLKERVAVVTGSNRGIGLEICRQLAAKGMLVILSCRDKAQGLAAAEKLQKQELAVRFHELDVDHAGSIMQLAEFVEKEFGRCDILVNNAGIFPDSLSGNASGETDSSALHVKIETINKALTTNVYGPLLMCQALIPLMKKNNYGRIVNVSSGLGQLTDMQGGYPAYRLSKTALNVLTRMFSHELKEFNILVNSMSPGWVKTQMGGPQAPLSVEEGADTAIWLATAPDSGPTGKFFKERKEMAW